VPSNNDPTGGIDKLESPTSDRSFKMETTNDWNDEELVSLVSQKLHP